MLLMIIEEGVRNGGRDIGGVKLRTESEASWREVHFTSLSPCLLSSISPLKFHHDHAINPHRTQEWT